jgi:hypothetical protein
MLMSSTGWSVRWQAIADCRPSARVARRRQTNVTLISALVETSKGACWNRTSDLSISSAHKALARWGVATQHGAFSHVAAIDRVQVQPQCSNVGHRDSESAIWQWLDQTQSKWSRKSLMGFSNHW